MRRFEHKIVDADDLLDEGPGGTLGDHGWRVVGVVNGLRIVLEREVSA